MHNIYAYQIHFGRFPAIKVLYHFHVTLSLPPQAAGTVGMTVHPMKYNMGGFRENDKTVRKRFFFFDEKKGKTNNKMRGDNDKNFC